MLFAEKESNLINDFQRLKTEEIFLVHETDDLEMIVDSILNPEIWAKWTDASAKNVPPPDFYCDDLKLMMEVMRVDDHGFKKKGNIINPTYDREHQIEKQLRDVGILDMFPNAELFVTANTGLPSRITITNTILRITKERLRITSEKYPNTKKITLTIN